MFCKCKCDLIDNSKEEIEILKQRIAKLEKREGSFSAALYYSNEFNAICNYLGVCLKPLSNQVQGVIGYQCESDHEAYSAPDRINIKKLEPLVKDFQILLDFLNLEIKDEEMPRMERKIINRKKGKK